MYVFFYFDTSLTPLHLLLLGLDCALTSSAPVVTTFSSKNGVSTMRIEHHTAAGHTLHFMSPKEPKPALMALSATDDGSPYSHSSSAEDENDADGADGAGGSGGGSKRGRKSIAATRSKLKAMALEKKGGRLLFSSQSSSVDVLKLLPLTSLEGKRMDALCSRVRIFRLYAHRYQNYDPGGETLVPGTSTSSSSPSGGGSRGSFSMSGVGSGVSSSRGGSGSGGGVGAAASVRHEKQRVPPIDLCEAVTLQCLALIDDLRKGENNLTPPRHLNVAEAMKEANATLPAVFVTLFTGEPDARVQRMAMECKVLDAVFEAALAPYTSYQ